MAVKNDVTPYRDGDDHVVLTGADARPAGDPGEHTRLGQPFRVVATLRNNRLVRAREELGFASCQAAAKALDLPYHTLSAFEAFRKSPWSDNRNVLGWLPSARRVAAAYGYSCEELWPEITARVERTRAVLECAAADAAALPSAPEVVDGRRLRERAAKALAALTEREREVLKARFGFGGGEDRQDFEIADDLGLSRERVRQIGALALEKLRRPANRRHLEPFRDEHSPHPDLGERPPPGPPPAPAALVERARKVETLLFGAWWNRARHEAGVLADWTRERDALVRENAAVSAATRAWGARVREYCEGRAGDGALFLAAQALERAWRGALTELQTAEEHG